MQVVVVVVVPMQGLAGQVEKVSGVEEGYNAHSG